MKYPFLLAGLLLAALLSGCGNGGAASTSIGGSVTGLTSGLSLVLDNNGSETVTVTADGAFSFGGQEKAGSLYAVTVATNPPGETCAVSNGSGTVGQYAEDVSNIVVTCTVVSGTVFGTVSGLASGAIVVLEDQQAIFDFAPPTTLSVSANGLFTFPTLVVEGNVYDVIVSTQPAGQTCTVTNGSGTIPAKGSISAVQVTCQ